jgi:hypothetical protein
MSFSMLWVMSMLVRVANDDDGPIAVKTATTDDDRARLDLEAQRLRTASHPGLVAVVGANALSADGELRTRFAGDPVSRWTGSLAHVAGLGAAVAATLADLHEIGIVHGRVDASHVLVGDDGRPRLCGLSHAGDVSPSDDVHDLGRLLHDLLRRLPPQRRRLGRLGARGDSERRALDRVIARALDPVATRRPRAHTLAATLLDAVPGAALPHDIDTAATDDRSGGADVAPMGPHDLVEGAAVDEAVGDHDPAAPTEDHDDELLHIVLAHEQTEAERWAKAFGGDPGVDDTDSARGDGPWTAEGELAPPTDDDAWSLPPPPSKALSSSDSAEDAPPQVGRATATPDRIDTFGASGSTAARSRPVDRAGRRRATGTEHRTPTARRQRLGALLGTSGLFAAGMIAAAFVVATRADAPATPTPGRSASGAAAPAVAACPELAGPAADVDGDGCAEAVVVEGGTISAGTARWTLGEPGDLAAVGDWDCDGADSPALLRPATGDVFVFPGWAIHDRPVTVHAAGTVDGGIGIRAQGRTDGCDDLLVDLASGSATTVAVPP